LETVSGAATATRYLANRRSRLEQIARLGHSGSPRGAISPGLRIVVHGNYNICFRVSRTETVIARVVHSAHDVRRSSFHADPAPPMRPAAASP
jgi:plasmid stabilization system protein ParE